jgi:hypothetical protein
MTRKVAALCAICVFGIVRAQAEPPAPPKSATAQAQSSQVPYTIETASILNTGAETNAAEADAGHVSISNDDATVDEVLTAAHDGYRFVAYIVTWHGSRVAISDMFATTRYVAGESIVFPVSRAESPRRGQGRPRRFNLGTAASFLSRRAHACWRCAEDLARRSTPDTGLRDGCQPHGVHY